MAHKKLNGKVGDWSLRTMEKRAYDDTIFSGDPTKLMPRLKQIHKFSEFPTGYGPEDLDAMKQSPGKIKSSQGFEYAETGTNRESRYGKPKRWSPGKIKQAAGIMGRIPSMSAQYYMRGMGETGDEKSMPIELVSMAGPIAAQGANMSQMANQLAKRPNRRLIEKHRAREADSARIIQGLMMDLERLRMEKGAEAVIKTKLLPHQERVVKKLRDRPGLVVAHGLGSGKTLSSIAAAIRLRPGRTQVLVPASLQANYQKELSKHVSGDLPPIEVGSLQGAAMKGHIPDADLLIVDEAHRGRNPSSKTYQLIRGSKNKKRLLLTASPTYNSPADVAAMVNMAAGEHILPLGASFDKQYIAKPSGGLLGLLPFTRKQTELKNKASLRRTLERWVDYHKSGGEGFPDVTEENYSVKMSPRQTKLHDAAWGKLSFISKLRLQRGLPPEKQDLSKINNFQSQTRQISGSESQYSKDKVEASPKVMKAVGLLDTEVKSNPNHKALIYSNYLGTLRDYSDELAKKNISHAIFSGQEKMRDRKQMVEDYNAGKLKALLVSSAGGEGLDLKGTRQVQVLEPHWNVEKLKQVEGRAIRRGSHAHLPKSEQNVTLQRFDAYPRGGIFKKRRGVEQVLGDMAANKERLNQELVGLLEKQAYKLQGQTEVQGIPIAIENRKGSVRKGTDSDGHEWRTKMKNPYGYIKGTKGADGEPVDAYVGPDKEAPDAFVVHQHRPVDLHDAQLAEGLSNRGVGDSQPSGYLADAIAFLKKAHSLLPTELKLPGRGLRRESSVFEDFVHGRLRDTKMMRDVPDSSTLFAHLFRLVQVPETWSAVKSAMLSLLDNLEIRRIVIKSVPINVVNDLRSGKLSSEEALHDYPMFQALSTFVIDEAVKRVPAKPSNVSSGTGSSHIDDSKWVFDECKVMLGFPNKMEAKKAYLAHYDDPKFLGPISRVSTERLKELADNKKKLIKISQAATSSKQKKPFDALQAIANRPWPKLTKQQKKFMQAEARYAEMHDFVF